MTSPTCLALPKIRFERGFLADRARLVRDVVIPYQWEALNDRIPGAERSGTREQFPDRRRREGREVLRLLVPGLRPREVDRGGVVPARDAPGRGARRRARRHDRDDREGAAGRRLPRHLHPARRTDKKWANLFEFHELYIAGPLHRGGRRALRGDRQAHAAGHRQQAGRHDRAHLRHRAPARSRATAATRRSSSRWSSWPAPPGKNVMRSSRPTSSTSAARRRCISRPSPSG